MKAGATRWLGLRDTLWPMPSAGSNGLRVVSWKIEGVRFGFGAQLRESREPLGSPTNRKASYACVRIAHGPS
jgi:hypothetical protein